MVGLGLTANSRRQELQFDPFYAAWPMARSSVRSTALFCLCTIGWWLTVQVGICLADWPQFMHDAAHTADAADADLNLPLQLKHRVQLEDAVLTSPAVVDGQVFVVDQSGAAYCISATDGLVVWKTAPPGAASANGNTSSPAVMHGQMAYGTTAG